MLPTQHAALTALAAIPLIRRGWSPWRVAQFTAAAVLIDADHYASYAVKIRDLSLWRAYRFHRRRGEHPFRLHHPAVVVDAHRPLHAPALLLTLTVLARRFPVLWPLVAGMLFHRFLDYAWSATHALRALRRRTWPAGKAGAPYPYDDTYDGTAYQRTLK
jgi:hypothetical protein